MAPTTPSITTQAWVDIPKKFWDNINILHPTTKILLDKDEKQDGGLSYAPNRVALKDTGGGYFAATNTSAVLVASQTNELLNETYNWVHCINDILITYDEQIRAGESPFTRVTAMERAKYAAKMRHLDILALGIMNGVSTTPNQPDGLVQLINPTATYGGVNPANDTDWVSQATTAATTLSGPSIVETMIDNSSWLGEQPTHIPTTRTLFSRCKAIWGQGLTYEAKEDGEATYGLEKISIRGGLNGKVAKIYWDDDMPVSNMWAIDMDVTHVKKSTLHFMDTKDPIMPESGLNIIVAEVGYVLSSYITGSELRRVHGGWTALTV
jgi:hypothetical protein